jgi:hypothetical protein
VLYPQGPRRRSRTYAGFSATLCGPRDQAPGRTRCGSTGVVGHQRLPSYRRWPLSIRGPVRHSKSSLQNKGLRRPGYSAIHRLDGPVMRASVQSVRQSDAASLPRWGFASAGGRPRSPTGASRGGRYKPRGGPSQPTMVSVACDQRHRHAPPPARSYTSRCQHSRCPASFPSIETSMADR